MHISVCISTYQRPALLSELLSSLENQKTDELFSYSIVVADNDAAESARALLNELIPHFKVPLSYHTESRRSIAHVRNKTIAESSGELIAFIDDDEEPEETWLLEMFRALTAYDCAGVLGPVEPLYPEAAPDWVRKGRFFDRPRHPTGHLMPWTECRTGNVLFRRSIIQGISPVFSPAFGTGGSDVDFFRRMIASGHEFRWCDTAPVLEIVAPSRWKRRILLKRALLRGRNSFRHPRHRWRGVGKAIIAIPVYTLLLPLFQLRGHYLFMRYAIKLGDHWGRLLAAFGIEVVKKREM